MTEFKNHSELIATDSKDGIELIREASKILPCPFSYENPYKRIEIRLNKRFYAVHFRLVDSGPNWIVTKIYADITHLFYLNRDGVID